MPALETEFTALKADWLAIKQATGDRISEAGAAGLSLDVAMTTLELTLMKVIYTAGLAFVGNVAMGPKLFDQSRLYNPKSAEAPTAPPTT